ncbi:hypothetical protein GCM10007880_16890 [Mesorhizobium amorphae]|nr:hypothetical protein GCM10007880_16890 [Mesorhizobium amorphae]
MQHEGIGIGTEFRNDEGNTLNHEARDEGDVSGEAIELGHDYRAFCLSRLGEGGC